jgi:hypothetical protein
LCHVLPVEGHPRVGLCRGVGLPDAEPDARRACEGGSAIGCRAHLRLASRAPETEVHRCHQCLGRCHRLGKPFLVTAVASAVGERAEVEYAPCVCPEVPSLPAYRSRAGLAERERLRLPISSAPVPVPCVARVCKTHGRVSV